MAIDASAGPGTNVEGIEVTAKGNLPGVLVNAGGSGSIGVDSTGGANTAGINGTGGAGSAAGVIGKGTGASNGVLAQGGPTDGTAIRGIAAPAATNAIGVQGEGKGNLAGVKGIGDDGPGIHGTTSGDGYGVVAQGAPVPTTESASLRIVPQSTEPGTLDDGAVWIQNDTNLLYTQVNSLIETIITNRSIHAPKAMGIIDAGNSFGVPVVRAGDLNIGTPSYVSSILRVPFTTAMSGVDYFAAIAFKSSVPYFLSISNQTATEIEIRRNDQSGAQVSFNLAQDIAVTVIVFGLGGIA
jgi:hypothetical protein